MPASGILCCAATGVVPNFQRKTYTAGYPCQWSKNDPLKLTFADALVPVTADEKDDAVNVQPVQVIVPLLRLLSAGVLAPVPAFSVLELIDIVPAPSLLTHLKDAAFIVLPEMVIVPVAEAFCTAGPAAPAVMVDDVILQPPLPVIDTPEAAGLFDDPPVITELDMLIVPVEALRTGSDCVPPPGIKLQFAMFIVAELLFLNPKALVADPPPMFRPSSVSVPVDALTSRQIVVPERMSAFSEKIVGIKKLPPPVVAPAGVFVAVVRVASARAVPLLPDVPVPLD